ncbi:hypothetical protein BC938DRAFT_479459, partial [Jimgerdemannia flammicorona]
RPPAPGAPRDKGVVLTPHEPKTAVIRAWLDGTDSNAVGDVSAHATICSALYLDIMRQTAPGQENSAIPTPPRADTPWDFRAAAVDPLAYIDERYEVGAIGERVRMTVALLEEALAPLETDGGAKYRVQLHIVNLLSFVWHNQCEFPDWAMQWLFPLYTPPPLDDNVPVPKFLKKVPNFVVLAQRLIPSLVYQFSGTIGNEAHALSVDEVQGFANAESVPNLDLLASSTPAQDLLSARLVTILLYALREIPPSTKDSKNLKCAEEILNTLDVCLASLESKGGIFFGLVAAFVVQADAIGFILAWTTSAAAPQMAPVCCKILGTLHSLFELLELKSMKDQLVQQLRARSAKIASIIVRLQRCDQFLTVIVPLARLGARLGPVQGDLKKDFFDACYKLGTNFLTKFKTDLEKANIKALKDRKLSFRSSRVMCTQMRMLLRTLQKLEPSSVGQAYESVEIRAVQDQIANMESSDIIPATTRLTLGERQRYAGLPFDQALKSIESNALVAKWKSRFAAPVSKSKHDAFYDLVTDDRGILERVMTMGDTELDTLAGDIVAAAGVQPMSLKMLEGVDENELVDRVMAECLESFFRTVQSVPTIDPAYLRKFVPWVLCEAVMLSEKSGTDATNKPVANRRSSKCVIY